MRSSRHIGTLAIASLLLNVALGGVLLNRVPVSSAAAGYSVGRDTSGSARVQAGKPLEAGRRRPREARRHWPDWQTIRDDHRTVYRDNLRALGCPENAVQAILVAEVQAWTEAEFARQPRDADCNLNGSRLRAWLRNERESRRRLELQERAALEQLLGVPWNQLPTYTLTTMRWAWGNRMLNFLPGDRFGPIHAAFLKVEDLHEYYEPRVTRWMSPGELEEVRREIAVALSEFHQLLTTAEREDIELRMLAGDHIPEGWMAAEFRGCMSGTELRERLRTERQSLLAIDPARDIILESHFNLEP
jgi:hypothetical protein